MIGRHHYVSLVIGPQQELACDFSASVLEWSDEHGANKFDRISLVAILSSSMGPLLAGSFACPNPPPRRSLLQS